MIKSNAQRILDLGLDRYGYRYVNIDDCWLLAMPVARVGGLSIVTRCLAARRAVALAPAFDARLLPQVAALADALLAESPDIAEAVIARWVGSAARYASA